MKRVFSHHSNVRGSLSFSYRRRPIFGCAGTLELGQANRIWCILSILGVSHLESRMVNHLAPRPAGLTWPSRRLIDGQKLRFYQVYTFGADDSRYCSFDTWPNPLKTLTLGTHHHPKNFSSTNTLHSNPMCGQNDHCPGCGAGLKQSLILQSAFVGAVKPFLDAVQVNITVCCM